MHFEDADQQIIRSTTQRGLMLHWERSKKERPLLPLTEFDLDGRCHDAGQLSFCAVEGINDGVSFRVLREGSQVMAAYDSDWTGQYLHDVLPRHVKDTVLAAFDRCRENALRSIRCHQLLMSPEYSLTVNDFYCRSVSATRLRTSSPRCN